MAPDPAFNATLNGGPSAVPDTSFRCPLSCRTAYKLPFIRKGGHV